MQGSESQENDKLSAPPGHEDPPEALRLIVRVFDWRALLGLLGGLIALGYAVMMLS